MGKLNLANYQPRDDSSANTEQYRAFDEQDDLILRQTSDHCLCGCGQPPAGKTSKFKMGHDARLRGKLIRAYCTGTLVTTIGEDTVTRVTAMELAEELGWAEYLKVAAEREAVRSDERAERASAALLRQATGPQVGDFKLIKVGRWSKTGQVVAVFESENHDGTKLIDFQYVTSGGETKRITNPTILGETSAEAIA